MFEDLAGADLAAALAGAHVASLDADAALGYALAAARLAGWAAAVEGAGLARVRQAYPVLDTDSVVSREVHHLDADRLVVAEVRAAYGCSQNAASAKMAFAEFLTDMPAVATALTGGRIRLEHARLLARETAPLAGVPAARRVVVEELLAAHAAAAAATGSGWTMRQWATRTCRAVLAVDPARAERSAADTQAERRVWHTADTAHGEGVLGLAGPVQATAACHAAVDALARQWRARGRPGTLAQLRFDAAHHLLTARPDQHSAGTVVLGQVTIPLSSLVGVDDAPGELAGVGPVPASVARELMARASLWRRLLTDPVDGHLVTQEIKGYRPTAAMRRFVLTRAGGVCTARGCGARHGLQIDHVTAYPGGPTSVINLDPQCPPDHNGKTHGGWVHTLDPESGMLTQTSPLGRTHTTVPTPPVGPTGRHPHPDGRYPAGVPVDPDEVYFPTGEPPPDPADGETGPPDPAAEVDRWPTIAARTAALLDTQRRTRRDRARLARRQRLAAQRAVAHAAARAEAAERPLLHQLHADLDATTDHQLIAAINAEYLADDQHQNPYQPAHAGDLAVWIQLVQELAA